MAKKIDIDTRTFVRFWLVILGFLAVAWFVYRAMAGIVLVLLAVFLAVALMPLARKIDTIDGKKERNSLSSIMAVVLVVAALIGVVAIIGPMVVGEVTKFVGQASKDVETATGQVDLDAFGKSIGIEGLRGQIVTAVKGWSSDFLGNFGNFAFSSIGAIGGFLTSTVLVVVLTILFMLQGPSLMGRLWGVVEKRSGKKAVDVWSRVVSRIAKVISKYVAGQALVAVLDGVASMIIIFLISLVFGVPMSFIVPLGMFAAVMFMIPMFGPVITCVVTAVLLGVNSLVAAAVYIVLYMVYEQIEGNMISPKIQGKGVGLSPLVILVSITIGMYAFGVMGTFIAIPVAGCVKVLLEEYPNIKALGE